MFTDYIFVKNQEEVDKAERMGLAVEVLYESNTLVINKHDIGLALINPKGNIDIEIRGYSYELKFKQSLWREITETLQAKEAEYESNDSK